MLNTLICWLFIEFYETGTLWRETRGWHEYTLQGVPEWGNQLLHHTLITVWPVCLTKMSTKTTTSGPIVWRHVLNGPCNVSEIDKNALTLFQSLSDFYVKRTSTILIVKGKIHQTFISQFSPLADFSNGKCQYFSTLIYITLNIVGCKGVVQCSELRCVWSYLATLMD